jgi:hypothetical protein
MVEYIDNGHDVKTHDNDTLKCKRLEWVEAMLKPRGLTRFRRR